MKTIDTLIEDMNAVVAGKGGWDATVTEFFIDTLGSLTKARFEEEQKPRDYLSMSMLGTKCDRRLWSKVNEPNAGEELTSEAYGTFFYGDMLEVLAVSLAIAAGHNVEGYQEKLEVDGVPGSGDCIIDGIVIDVKSASRFGLPKFVRNGLKNDDPFAYISQLSSYLKAYENDPRVHDKTRAGFLVVGKDRFKLVLDMYDLTDELEYKSDEIARAKSVVASPENNFDRLPTVTDGESGNMKLDVYCSYCEQKYRCFPNIRTFFYSNGPRYLTKVAREPAKTVPEKGVKFENGERKG